MLQSLVLISLLGLAIGLPADHIYDPEDPPITRYYHETVGIAEAARIKAAEESITFDGSRIVGGSNAALGQYPHLGGLIITLNDGRTSVCGSSLISNTRAVTAAHCWFDGGNQARQFLIVLGSTTLFSGGTRVTTDDVITHELWNPNTIENDIALMAIDWVDYNDNIRNIALASGSNLHVGANAWIAGFGRQSEGSDITTDQQLHHTQVDVISNAECASWFGNAIRETTICTDGSPRRSTCSGDSGGPLQIDGPTLIGITSFVYNGGCAQGWPAAFTRVSSYEFWIRSRM